MDRERQTPVFGVVAMAMLMDSEQYERALAFLDRAAGREHASALPDLGGMPVDAGLDLGLKEAFASFRNRGEWPRQYAVYCSGWNEVEGVLLMTAETQFDADIRVSLAAANERALRDLLLSFPRGPVALLFACGEWTKPAVFDALDGELLTAEAADQDDVRRIYAFRGIKKGHRAYQSVPSDRLLRPRLVREGQAAPGSAGPEPFTAMQVSGKKDPVIEEFRELDTIKGRAERSKFVVEGELIVKRAAEGGLPVDKVLFTTDLPADPAGRELVMMLRDRGIAHFAVSGGLMGAITQTRPVPKIMASVHASLHDVRDLDLQAVSAMLICDTVSNPDNLGMILRTADASGIEAVVLIGDAAQAYNKNTIRGARGAVGRLPIYTCAEEERFFDRLHQSGYRIIGTSAKASGDFYAMPLDGRTAFVVGNESSGIRESVLARCTDTVRIPMAPGQSSLNVGIATSVLLYELVRHRMAGVEQ